MKFSDANTIFGQVSVNKNVAACRYRPTIRNTVNRRRKR